MKARIKKSAGGCFWVGQVYGKTGWRTVTGLCYTKTGAKRGLMNWKAKNHSDKFEI